MSRPRRHRGDKEEAQFVDQVMYLLTAPYITWPGQESIYQMGDNKTQARLQRLARHKEIFENQECTEFKVMLYISTATLEHPISHDWYIVYGWLFKRHNLAAAADIFEEHEIPEELHSYPQKENLARLRKWLFRAQMNHLRRGMAGVDQAAVEKEAREIEGEQPRLF